MVVEEDIRPYNILVNRMLRLSDRNLTFRVLLTLLERTALELSPYDEPDSSAVKFVGLVMRYIWRRTKSIAEDVRDGLIQVDQLLQECHLFIAASPPAIWVRRTDEQYPLTNQPLRTVKTILHELAGELGIKVLDICRQAIPAAGNKGYIYLYLERVLEEGNARVAAAIASDTPMDKANAAAVTTITIVTNEIANSKQNNSAVSSTSQAVEIDARATVTTNDDVNEAPLPTIATTAALAVASGMTANADIIPMPNDEKKTIENNNNNNNEEEEEREGEEDEHDGNEENAHHEEANSKEAEEDESLTRKSAAFLLQDGTHYKFPGRPGFTILHKSRRRVLHARPPSARKSTTPVKNDSPVPIATTITVTATPLAEVAPPAPFIAATTAPAADSTTQIPIHPSDFRPDPELCLKLTSMFAKLFIAEEREEVSNTGD
ncbi:hypothetical protein BDF19DRAFT_49530 [Syncephalis fuscata]|nr:hypothetical protein BDF19DRAFT_49530 [Syncephalis fuscata]